MTRVAVLAALLCACHRSEVTPAAGDGGAPTRASVILQENERAGDPDWFSGFTNSWNRQIEGFADRVSALAGESVDVRVHADAVKHGRWTLYRLGWYGGAGARRIAESGVTYAPQPPCTEDRPTGSIRCLTWSRTFSIAIPPDAVSGLYLIRILRDDGIGGFIPLVVRDGRAADLLFQASVTTYQAYNSYGRDSLYESDDAIRGAQAVRVSFDRPYRGDWGAGHVLRWEVHAARFLERFGYDVTYTTNLDVHREGQAAITRCKAFLSVGHDEYWSGEERDAVEGARDAGVALLFLGANSAYWKIRLSEPGADGNPRVITCYKQFPQDDPEYGKPDQTGRFRDDPIGRPESALAGIMYEGWMFFDQPWVVSDGSHFLLEGTGLSTGDTIPQLVGYEYDNAARGGAPAPLDVLARSPVVDADGVPNESVTAAYVASSGALVFATGTIEWSVALEGAAADARIQRITANVLLAAVGAPVPDALTAVAPPPAPAIDPAWAGSVVTVGSGFAGAAGVAKLPDGTILVADARAHRIWQLAGGAPQPFAGDGHGSSSPRYDGVPALQARFFMPTALATDARGRVYVADTNNHAIRLIADDSARTVTTIAGTFGRAGYADGVGSAAQLNLPMALAWKDATHLLVADNGNHAIRVIDVTTRGVTTLAGGRDGLENDGPAATASFLFPTAVTAAPDGTVYFVASSTGKLKAIGTDAAHTVRSLTTGGLGLADGTGSSARLGAQEGLVWWQGALVAADPGNHRLRLVSPGKDAASTRVRTLAGSGRADDQDGSGAEASFSTPLGLFKDTDSTLLVADGRVVRLVRP